MKSIWFLEISQGTQFFQLEFSLKNNLSRILLMLDYKTKRYY
jgi:hypothetical protein